MFMRLFFLLMSWSAWRWWYQRLAENYQQKDWLFMNYGYAPLQEGVKLPLQSGDEENRLFIQLYEHALSGIELKGKTVLEVGSGRGGGADYMARYHSPASMVGVDFAPSAIELCNKFYHEPNLQFVEGNAEKLPFADHQFDVVLNIESSHCYGNMSAFVNEAIRVLKPGGYFVWADLRTADSLTKEDALFKRSPLILISKENITPNVLKALTLISNYKEVTIQERVPTGWKSIFSQFAGVRNSKIFRAFQEGKMVYSVYQFKKPTDIN